MINLPFILGVNICAVLEQQLNDPCSVVAGSQVQWSGPSAVARVAIHVQGIQQRRQFLLSTGSGSFE
jgi:hypothetical protein